MIFSILLRSRSGILRGMRCIQSRLEDLKHCWPRAYGPAPVGGRQEGWCTPPQDVLGSATQGMGGQPAAAGWAKQVGSPKDNVNSAGRRKFYPKASVQQGWRDKYQAANLSWMPRNLAYVCWVKKACCSKRMSKIPCGELILKQSNFWNANIFLKMQWGDTTVCLRSVCENVCSSFS